MLMSPSIWFGLAAAAAITWGSWEHSGRADEAAERAKVEASLTVSRAQIKTLAQDLEAQNAAALHVYQVTEAARARAQQDLARERVKRRSAESRAEASEAHAQAPAPAGADCRQAWAEIEAEHRP